MPFPPNLTARKKEEEARGEEKEAPTLCMPTIRIRAPCTLVLPRRQGFAQRTAFVIREWKQREKETRVSNKGICRVDEGQRSLRLPFHSLESQRNGREKGGAPWGRDSAVSVGAEDVSISRVVSSRWLVLVAGTKGTPKMDTE